MAPKTPTGVPTFPLKGGDTWKWRIYDFADFPHSEGWQLLYEALGITTLHIDTGMVVYTTTGDDAGYWVVTVPKASTTLTPGRYRLIGRVVGSGTYNGLEYTISDGWLVVDKDPRTAAAGDYQTHAEKMLKLIESEITARTGGLGSSHESYQVDGRMINKIRWSELIRLRSKYAMQVYQERTGRMGRPIGVVFGQTDR